MRWSSMMTSKGCFSARSLRFSVRNSAHGWLGPMHFTRRSTAVYASRAIRPSLKRRSSISVPWALGTPVEGRYRAGGTKGWSGSGPSESSSPRGGGLNLLRGSQQHEVASGSHDSTLSRRLVCRSDFYRTNGEPSHCVGATETGFIGFARLACASGDWACGAYLPASSPLRGETASPASSPFGTPVLAACATGWPSSGTCATYVLC